MERPVQPKVVGMVLGAIGLVVLALLAESFGYGALAGVTVVGALAAIGVYAIKSRSMKSVVTPTVESGTPLHPQIFR